MARKKRPDSCGLGPALEVIGGKWKAVILWEVCEKPLRFGELKRRLPDISEKMLIQHLRELEAHGVIHRKDYQEVPPRVEYSITSYGKSLNDAITPLAAWGRKYEKRILAVSEE
jgi:DNA-binding HxlR family transcriptional regulator